VLVLVLVLVLDLSLPGARTRTRTTDEDEKAFVTQRAGLSGGPLPPIGLWYYGQSRRHWPMMAFSRRKP
jgi:hypothetical protein